MIELVISDSI